MSVDTQAQSDALLIVSRIAQGDNPRHAHSARFLLEAVEAYFDSPFHEEASRDIRMLLDLTRMDVLAAERTVTHTPPR